MSQDPVRLLDDPSVPDLLREDLAEAAAQPLPAVGTAAGLASLQASIKAGGGATAAAKATALAHASWWSGALIGGGAGADQGRGDLARASPHAALAAAFARADRGHSGALEQHGRVEPHADRGQRGLAFRSISAPRAQPSRPEPSSPPSALAGPEASASASPPLQWTAPRRSSICSCGSSRRRRAIPRPRSPSSRKDTAASRAARSIKSASRSPSSRSRSSAAPPRRASARSTFSTPIRKAPTPNGCEA